MNQQEWIKIFVLMTKLIGAIILVTLGKRFRNQARWVALAVSLGSLALFIAYLPALQAGANTPFELDYMPALGIKLSLNIDWLSFPFLLTEEFVTIFAIIYSLGYIKTDQRTHLFYGLLLFFSAGMSGTTLANDIFLFYFFWELMLIASAFLIVNWGESEKRNATALKYFIITHLGSLFVLVALIIVYSQSGIDQFSRLWEAFQVNPDNLRLVGSLFLIGFGVKMAVVPFHIWLPDTHAEAPMPVTIMLAAAMLSMGTYGILRFPMSFLTLEQFAVFSFPLMLFGVISEMYGAIMALVERDIKRIIAYSSISQMGYILFGLGTLTVYGVVGSTLHVVYHAIVKALLFCCAGWIIKETGRRDINDIRRIGSGRPLLTVCTMIGALSMAGVPALALFNSEWMIFSSGFQTPYTALAVIEVLGSILTAVYILRFVGLLFFASGKETPAKEIAPASVKVATGLLAILTVIAGFFPAPLFSYVINEVPLILGGIW
jgi:NADH-quinone oxidoreductase subunit M